MSTERGRSRPLSSFLLGGLALGAGAAAVAFARRWLDVVEVQGNSMAPTLLPGEWLLVEQRTYTRRPPRVGEIVLAADPRDPSRELIKRVAGIDAASGLVELAGDAPEASTDSRTFGRIHADQVRWRVIARYWPADRVGSLIGEGPARAAPSDSIDE
jgi:nickel-type superoxide dismutase maturation protease